MANISCMEFKKLFRGQKYQMSNLNREIENFAVGTVNNVVGLIQPTFMNEGLFSLPSRKEKLLDLGDLQQL